ncbi:MAG: serine/threonine-protein phosphatase [Rhodoferax sp.]|nr:MAG: serine/threonine-protein phosphatase [Rhodoferax sp.]
MKFSVFQISRKGGREKNEDRHGYCYTKSSGLFMLADGMGGHPDGEVAAQIALQTVTALYQKEATPSVKDAAAFFNLAILSAHRQILRYAAEKGLLDTPRTTFVAALMQDGAVSWVHCGDSRLYFVREGELLARTRDHSYLEQAGNDKAKIAALGMNRNVLFTCLGSPVRPVFDVTGPVALKEGDRLMICSDGLWGSIDDAEIVYELSHKRLNDATPDLVETALRKGGSHCDNVTVIAVEWETPDSFESTRGSISTQMMEDGVFASTVQAGGFEPGADDLDDEAIERSIAEINDAIRRSAAVRKP